MSKQSKKNTSGTYKQMERMLGAMVEQLGTGNIDWVKLAEELGEKGNNSKAALQMRYRRFKDKMTADKKHDSSGKKDGPGGKEGPGSGSGGGTDNGVAV